ncbi:MAG: ComEA family DNA-binding protein [Chloroflexota bacterium]
MRQALYVLLGVLAGFILAGGLLFVMRTPAGEPIILQPAPTEKPIAVHVVGAVPRPGLYEFAEGARVQDAIDAAGGLLAEADPGSMNLAALLEDGQQLDIPYAAGAEPQQGTGEGSGAFGDPFGTETPTEAVDVDLVNINTATAEELDGLPGIGPTTAQKIIEYREVNGPFLQIEDIMNVSGIGPSTFENIKDLITV